MKRQRIFIVDDHHLVRIGLRQLIELEPDLEVCGELAEGRDAAAQIVASNADVALLDLSLKDGYPGLRVIEDLQSLVYSGVILVLSMFDESLYAQRVLEAGARGYVTKDEAPDQVIGAIRRILAGKIHLSSDAMDQLLASRYGDAANGENCFSRLSNRQLQVLELLGRGKNNHDIAKSLSISVKTVESHCRDSQNKLNLDSKGELIRYAAIFINSQGRARSVNCG